MRQRQPTTTSAMGLDKPRPPNDSEHMVNNAHQRARRHAPDTRREQIAATADALALAHGLTGITHRSIASEMDVSHSLIAKYAPDVDAIRRDSLARLLGQELDDLRAKIAQIVATDRDLPPSAGAGQFAATGPATAKLKVIVSNFSRANRKEFAVIWLDGWVLGYRDRATALVNHKLMRAWQEEIEQILAEGVANGEFAVESTRDCAAEFVALLDGFNAHLLVDYGDVRDYPARIAASFASRLQIDPVQLLDVSAQLLNPPQHLPPAQETENV